MDEIKFVGPTKMGVGTHILNGGPDLRLMLEIFLGSIFFLFT